MRGIGSSGTSRTLVLSDGIPVTDAFGGWVIWGRIAPDMVERTEISRGATTSVFGDRAMGGAINFLSPTPNHENVSFGFEGGAKETLMPSASYTNFFRNRYGITAGVRTLSTDGYYIVPESIRGDADTPANVRYVAPMVKFDFVGTRDRFVLKSDIIAEERDNGTKLTKNSTSLGSVSGNYARTFGSRDSALSLLGFHQRQEYHASFSAISADRNTERLTVNQSVPADATGGAGFASFHHPGLNLTAGGDFLRSSGTSFDYLVPTGMRQGGGTIVQRGMFVQGDAAWKDFRFFFGSRYQWTGLSNGGTFYSPSGGLAYGRRWLRFRGSAYRSFRAPTLNELYREFRAGNTITQANDLLRPEALFGAEAGVDIVGERTRFSVTAYRNELTDLIGNVTLSTSPNQIIRQRQNIDGALARGVEATFRYTLGLWTWDSSYLFADSRFDSAARIPQVARNQGSSQLTWQRNGTLLSGGLRASSLQFEDDRNTQILPGYAVFHLVAQQQLARGFAVHFALENAFDRVYLSGLTPAAQIAAPQLWRAGIRWQGKFR